MADDAADRLPPGIGAPAERALTGAGYSRLEQLTHVTEADLGQLHGVGPKALRLLREALASSGRGFQPGTRRSGPH
jgi:predicted flap endonuclease-1-like 5' DNA nuclease